MTTSKGRENWVKAWRKYIEDGRYDGADGLIRFNKELGRLVNSGLITDADYNELSNYLSKRTPKSKRSNA